MSELEIFRNPEFGEIRTVVVEGEPWFVGKDVAEALGYSNPSKTLNDHVDDDDKGVTKRYTLGGTQEMTIINESGLYSLVLSSKLPTAKKFKRWVTSEVLPAIRKNGGYIAGTENMTEAEIMARAVLIGQRTIAEQQKRISELKPKAEYTEKVLASKGLITTTAIAKDYGMGAKSFNKLLNGLRIIYQLASGQWVLYSEYQKKGYTQSDTFAFNHTNGDPDSKMTTKWTEKGRLFLYNKLKKKGIVPTIERGGIIE
ncbi:phage antirepressor [Acidaminococcus massiliensis]|jgi:anti-repressor protein|uniref:phage antirepressor n=1 Tax=Acidaminococcus massiliensis TaxID=1852375 RepID=UPI00206677B7|nr:phage antirepressor [Acidaminococcus massiliensis]DAR24869.1 MAG TPA: repressor domain protein [Caudoviricetes sp.]